MVSARPEQDKEATRHKREIPVFVQSGSAVDTASHGSDVNWSELLDLAGDVAAEPEELWVV